MSIPSYVYVAADLTSVEFGHAWRTDRGSIVADVYFGQANLTFRSTSDARAAAAACIEAAEAMEALEAAPAEDQAAAPATPLDSASPPESGGDEDEASCPARSYGYDYFCTLTAGHPGDHFAAGSAPRGEEVTWPQAAPGAPGRGPGQCGCGATVDGAGNVTPAATS